MTTENEEKIVWFGLLAALALAWFCHRAIVWFLLAHWGKSTKGVVLGSLEQLDEGTLTYVVSYVFTTDSVFGKPRVRTGKQTTDYAFRPKDVIAVRFLPGWPGVNRIVERAV